MKRNLPISCRIQDFLGMLGIAIHNPFRNECTQDFGCCTNIGKYWLRINEEQIYKFIKPKAFKYEYASRYSGLIWKKLMDRFKNDSDFKIGANDVSDYVYNAILDALNGYSYPEETSVKNVEDVKTNNYESKEE
jgi:hypothetical protein